MSTVAMTLDPKESGAALGMMGKKSGLNEDDINLLVRCVRGGMSWPQAKRVLLQANPIDGHAVEGWKPEVLRRAGRGGQRDKPYSFEELAGTSPVRTLPRVTAVAAARMLQEGHSWASAKAAMVKRGVDPSLLEGCKAEIAAIAGGQAKEGSVGTIPTARGAFDQVSAASDPAALPLEDIEPQGTPEPDEPAPDEEPAPAPRKKPAKRSGKKRR